MPESSHTPLELPSADQLRAEIESLEARLKKLKRILKAVEGEEKTQ